MRLKIAGHKGYITRSTKLTKYENAYAFAHAKAVGTTDWKFKRPLVSAGVFLWALKASEAQFRFMWCLLIKAAVSSVLVAAHHQPCLRAKRLGFLKRAVENALLRQGCRGQPALVGRIIPPLLCLAASSSLEAVQTGAGRSLSLGEI